MSAVSVADVVVASGASSPGSQAVQGRSSSG
jgi:hypothetical protein